MKKNDDKLVELGIVACCIVLILDLFKKKNNITYTELTLPNGTAVDSNGLIILKTLLWFEPKEYFKNMIVPADNEIRNNYNILMDWIDVVRSNFEAPIIVELGYNANLPYHNKALGVVLRPVNKTSLQLYDKMLSFMRVVTYPKGEIKFNDKTVTFYLTGKNEFLGYKQ